MPSRGTSVPETGSWFARVTRASVFEALSLASQAQPLPWIPARAALKSLTRASVEPKSFSMAVFCGEEGPVSAGR